MKPTTYAMFPSKDKDRALADLVDGHRRCPESQGINTSRHHLNSSTKNPIPQSTFSFLNSTMELTLSYSPPGPQPDSRIYLQIGKRIFITSAFTLTSGFSYFAAAFFNRWQASQSSAENPFWIDADPDLFLHILRYLRNSVLFIFYNQSHGFDYGLYNALQNQAAFFLIEPLVTWIKEKRYLGAVIIHYATTELRGPGPQIAGYDAILDGNTERSYYPSWGTEKFYECPRGISSHMEHPSACGRACEKAMGEDGGYSDRDVLRTLVVARKTVFNSLVEVDGTGG